MLPAWGPCRANVQSISVDCVAAPYPVNTRRTFVAYAAAGYDLSTCSPQDIHIVDAVDLLGTSYIPWDAATVVSKTASHVTFTSTPRSSVFSASGGVTVTIGSTSVYCRVPVF